MPRATPKWKEKMPEFIGAVVCATKEADIRSACEEIKASVVESYPVVIDSRKNPMTEIREAIRGRFPAQKGKSADNPVPFPYFFTEDGKNKIKRWEHLAIKYLKAEWNPQTDWSDVEAKEVEIKQVESEVKPVETKIVDSDLDIFGYVGLSTEELAVVNHAVGDADVKEWVKQAIMQRANAINRLRESLDEDWASIPSEVLMNDKKYRTNSGACRELVNRAVRVVKQWNYDHPDQKWCITNKLISELTGITVKAIAKAVEGMDNESYNKGQGLEPVVNRLTRATVGEPSNVMSVANITGVEGGEVNYKPG